LLKELWEHTEPRGGAIRLGLAPWSRMRCSLQLRCCCCRSCCCCSCCCCCCCWPLLATRRTPTWGGCRFIHPPPPPPPVITCHLSPVTCHPVPSVRFSGSPPRWLTLPWVAVSAATAYVCQGTHPPTTPHHHPPPATTHHHPPPPPPTTCPSLPSHP